MDRLHRRTARKLVHRRDDGQGLARGMGWFSIALGTAQVVAPGGVCRLIGLPPTRLRRAVMFAIGLRELAAGAGILGRPRPSILLGSRVVADAMDLALLGNALRAPDVDRQRLAGALAAVTGAAIADVLATRKLGRLEKRARFITINRPLEEVAARWRELVGDELPELTAAPGGRGTEVRLAGGGGLDLRQFKQTVETGAIVHSDASLHGRPHSARPPRHHVQHEELQP